MIKKEIEPGIVKYTFDPESGKHYGFNIIALLDKKRVALIDTGYEKHMEEVLKDLESKGLTVDTVFISHFHSDHIYGLKKLSCVRIFGSAFYQETLDMYEEKEDHIYFIPTVPIIENREISYGKHNLTLIPFPGHSICTMLIRINDKYVYIADELMFSNSGRPLLPSTERDSIRRHLDSIYKLRDYKDYILIPGHGTSLNGEKEVLMDIENRLAYLRTILSAEERISYEEATRNCKIAFLHKEWHESLYE